MTKYIWHTQEDDKVRPWHAAKDGKIFDSEHPPKGGTPGDAPNCRCWAEPIEEEKERDSLYDRNKTGIVSREFESSNNPTAIGHDIKGGYSYGEIQIETKNSNTFDDFMKYLKKNPNYDDYYDYLQKAGGLAAAKNGERQFQRAWESVANDNRLRQAVHDFVIDKKVKPTIEKTRDIKGFDPQNRKSPVIEAIFSTAVQHGEGGAANIIHKALGKDVSDLSDAEIISKIYNERSKVDIYFRSQPPKIKHNIQKRLTNELNALIYQLR